MSDVSAAADALGVPESLVERSAKARAAASGTSEDEVLAAWAGGGTVERSSPAPSPEPEPPSEETPAEPEAPIVDAPAPAAPEPRPEAAPAPAAVAVAAPPEEDPVVASPLSDRIGVSGKVGAVVGLVAALVVILFSSQWLLPRAAVTGEEGSFQTVVEVTESWVIIGSALIGVAVGLALAGISRSVTGMLDRGMRLVSSSTATALVGVIVGGVGGAVVGAIVVGTGSPSELDPELTVVPVLAGLVWTVLGWIAVGWATGALVQAIGVPEGLDELESEETEPVKRRLASAFGIPLAAFVAILFVVLPLAFIFVQFPSFAPILAIVVSGGILAFAGLSASRPGMRITAGEFLVAGVGVGVILLILVSVLLVQGGGADHGDEEHDATETSSEPADEAEAALPHILSI